MCGSLRLAAHRNYLNGRLEKGARRQLKPSGRFKGQLPQRTGPHLQALLGRRTRLLPTARLQVSYAQRSGAQVLRDLFYF